jgi:hypothetical protein
MLFAPPARPGGETALHSYQPSKTKKPPKGGFFEFEKRD